MNFLPTIIFSDATGQDLFPKSTPAQAMSTMNEPFSGALSRARTLDESLAIVLEVLALHRTNKRQTLYVAGAISADGDHKIAENIERLISYRNTLASQHADQAFVFASPNIFTPGIYEQLKIFELPRAEREVKLQNFYDTIIESKHLDGIYFTPGWDRSTGAKIEHQTATRVGVPVWFL